MFLVFFRHHHVVVVVVVAIVAVSVSAGVGVGVGGRRPRRRRRLIFEALSSLEDRQSPRSGRWAKVFAKLPPDY